MPPGVGTLLPNLRELMVQMCELTPAALTTALDTACSRLQRVVAFDLSTRRAPLGAQQLNAQQQQATAQLRQLAKLPSLTSVELQDASCPTLFLLALGTQLTCLELSPSYRQCEPGTQTPTPGWRATLQHVARCTGLRELTLPCSTAEELGLVAPALQQLRELVLSSLSPTATDGDALMEVLLGLPHLTCLQWYVMSGHGLRHWYNDRPCRWEQVWFGEVTPRQLARLPLHSLKRPVTWDRLVVEQGSLVDEVRAAVVNVTRGCPAGFSWDEDRDDDDDNDDDDNPHLLRVHANARNRTGMLAALRALQPLFKPLTSIGVDSKWWGTELVKVLGEVLPRTCTRLVLFQGSVSGEALEQVARSLPWLAYLELRRQEVSPEDVVEYMRLARRLKSEGGVGRLDEVVVKLACPRRASKKEEKMRKSMWERAGRMVREEGLQMALTVVWLSDDDLERYAYV